THTTGALALRPRRISRAAAIAPYAADTGARMRAANPASRHQNAGSRIAARSPALEAQLHQIGVERRDGVLKPATQHGDDLASGRCAALTAGCILQPRSDPDRQLAHVGHLLGAVDLVQGVIDLGEVPNVRTVQNGRPE